MITFDGQVWAPGYFTPPLSPNFVSDGPRLIEFIDIAWPEIQLDDWQRALINHILERYPDDYPDERRRGRLRYRQSLVSMGRQ